MLLPCTSFHTTVNYDLSVKEKKAELLKMEFPQAHQMDQFWL